MAKYNTGNPLGSSDPKDLFDNAANLDHAVTGLQSSWTDRLGRSRKTLKGMSDEFDQSLIEHQEQVNDVVIAGGQIFPDEATGRAAVVDGAYYLTEGDSEDVATVLWERLDANASRRVAENPDGGLVAEINHRTQDVDYEPLAGTSFAVTDDAGNAALSVSDGKTVVPSARIGGLDVDRNEETPGAIYVTDDSGNSAFSIGEDGQVDLPISRISGMEVSDDTISGPEYSMAYTDNDGNVAFGIKRNGDVVVSNPEPTDQWHEFGLTDDDSIVHVGDSFTGSYYTLKDKSYVSALSSLSPFRHQNFGVSGDDLLDMQSRIINDTDYGDFNFGEMNGKYAFLSSYSNEGQFRSADLTYYAENFRRLIDTVRGAGAEPVVTTQFPSDSASFALLKGVADQEGCWFIDCTTINAEIGGLDEGPFHEGHPGTRTNGVFWQPMLEFIDSIPSPDKGIKIYRKRSTFSASSRDDLLFKDRVSKNKKWKELSVSHYCLSNPEKFEELSLGGLGGWDFIEDEYQRIAQGLPVQFADYGLFEVTLPGTAATLSGAEVQILVSGSFSAYVRNNLDVAASLPGKRDGITPESPEYQDRWDEPRGAWRPVSLSDGVISLGRDQLPYSMVGDKIQVLIEGAFSVSDIKIRYSGYKKVAKFTPADNKIIGQNLVQQPLCGTAAQLADWITSGNPSTIVPIDIYNAPTDPTTGNRVSGVCVISNADTIGQSVLLPAHDGRKRRYQITVWARHFPKAYLDPALYPGLDSAQLIDRVENPGAAPITEDTSDLRMLRCEAWPGAIYPDNGGAEFFDYTSLQWRAVTFIYDAVPYITGNELSFRLSCPDGEVQVAKVLIHEVI